MALRACVIGVLLTLGAVMVSAQTVLTPKGYELDVRIDYTAQELRASARVDLENLSSAPVVRTSFLLYRLLAVTSVTTDDGEELPFRQAVVAFEDFPELQVDQVIVQLPAPLEPGGHKAVTLRYRGYLLGYAETGMLYVKDRIDRDFTILRTDAFAYPVPGVPSLAANRSKAESRFGYSARITVPKDLVVANGGHLQSREAHGDEITFHYDSLEPSWRMDFAIAKYQEISTGGIRVEFLPGDETGARGVARAAKESLELYTGWFGPPPGERALTFIEIPDGWGSQTDVTTIIQSAAAFRNPKRHREVYHEISHLWNPRETDLPSPRWNEGLASFLEYLAAEKLSGEPTVDARADQLRQWLADQLPKHPEWRQIPLVDYGREQLTDLSYSVGALFFDLLYRLAGQEAFNRAIGQYSARFAATGGSTKDLVGVIQSATSQDLSKLFDDWLFTAHWADRIAAAGNIQELAAYYRPAVGSEGR